jgi:hypothetical protein
VDKPKQVSDGHGMSAYSPSTCSTWKWATTRGPSVTTTVVRTAIGRSAATLSGTSHRPSACDCHAPGSNPRNTNEAKPVSTVCGGTKAVTA